MAKTIYEGQEVPDFREMEDASNESSYSAADDAAEGLKAAIKKGRIRNELEEDMRVFVAPLEPNTRFLVHAGRVIWFRDPSSPTGKKDYEREGDAWAEFHSGICASDDEVVIEWCRAHAGDAELHKMYHDEQIALWQEAGDKNLAKPPTARDCGVDVGLCREIGDESVPAWAEMKVLQHPTSRRSAYLPANMDLDAMFRRLKPVGVMPDADKSRLAMAGEAAVNAERERTRGR